MTTEDPILESIEQVSDGWIKKYVLTYRMGDGSKHTYETASRKGLEDYRSALLHGIGDARPDAVCIVALTPENNLVMIREFRYPLNSWCIALPAGLLDAGETVAQCARRELSEETGYEVIDDRSIEPLPQPGFSSTGMTDESVQVVFVRAQKAREPRTEKNELIEVFELPVAQIGSFLRTNELPIGTRAQLILSTLEGRFNQG